MLDSIFALSAGALLAICFPKPAYYYLIFTALVPLIWAVKRNSSFEAFRLGFFAGCAFFSILLWWIGPTISTYGNLPLWAAWPVVGLLVCYLAIYPAIWSLVAAYAFKKSKTNSYSKALSLAALPALWVLLEWTRGHFLSGFPWGSLAYCLSEQASLIQSAEIWGIYGLGFLIIFINFLFFYAVELCLSKHLLKASMYLAAAVATLSIFYVWGNGKIEKVEHEQKGLTPIQVAAIQASVPQHLKWEPAYQENTIEKYIKLTGQALKKMDKERVRLVVWPETALPFYFQEDGPFSRKVLAFAKREKILLLLGSPAYIHKGGNDVAYLNSAYLVSPEGEVVGRYDKRHLVPFGEYMPWGWVTSWAKKFLPTAGEFMPGNSAAPLCSANICIGTLICFESIFPNLAAESTATGSNILAVITNDAWFGNTGAPYQHEAMAIFRAVENRRWLVRAANTGISSIISPWGQRIAESRLFEPAWIAGEARLCHHVTFYARYGPGWFLSACLLIVIMFFLTSGFEIKRSKAT